MLTPLAAVASGNGISATEQLLIVVFGTITAPIILTLINTWRSSKERDKLWAREDEKALDAAKERDADIERQEEVAKQAARAAALLATATADAAQKAEAARVALLASNERVAQVARESAYRIDSKLDVIHRLTNNQLLLAIKAEYDSTVRLAAVLRELVAANRRSGLEPAQESVDLLVTSDARILQLSEEVAERERLAADVTQQIEQNPKGGITTTLPGSQPPPEPETHET